MGPWYLYTKENQDAVEEMCDIQKFILSVISNPDILEFRGNKKLEFINYGRTQLVFVLTVNETKRYTILVTQPYEKVGIGKREFDNLKLLHTTCENVICPIYYFKSNDERELYITPYHEQARCVGILKNTWGIWVPEPNYHFEDFSENLRFLINSCMIATLIKSYHEMTNQGVIRCRLDGGDFMLDKGFTSDTKSILKNLTLIAARDLIKIDLQEYIKLIKEELLTKKNSNHIFLGKELREPFTSEEVFRGIELGLKLRKKC